MQEQYRLMSSKEKKAMAQDLVRFVHNRGGRFIQRERTVKGERWYEISNEKALEKSSQALRDTNTNETRKQKRKETVFD